MTDFIIDAFSQHLLTVLSYATYIITCKTCGNSMRVINKLIMRNDNS